MRLAALYSGGKESTYSIYLAERSGHRVPCLLTIVSENPDSYMYHTVNVKWTELQATAMEKEQLKRISKGIREEELRDLENITREAVSKYGIQGLLSGSVSSHYQRSRIEATSAKLGLQSVNPLWGRKETEILQDYLRLGFKIIFTGVSALGLDRSWLGRELDEKGVNELHELKTRYGVNLLGEGGEYETFVVDAPLFTKRILIEEASTIWERIRGRYLIKRAKLEARTLNRLM